MGLTLQQVQNLSEQQWDRLKEMTVLHTRLAREHITLFNTPGVEPRRMEIKQQIEKLRKERDEILESIN